MDPEHRQHPELIRKADIQALPQTYRIKTAV